LADAVALINSKLLGRLSPISEQGLLGASFDEVAPRKRRVAEEVSGVGVGAGSTGEFVRLEGEYRGRRLKSKFQEGGIAGDSIGKGNPDLVVAGGGQGLPFRIGNCFALQSNLDLGLETFGGGPGWRARRKQVEQAVGNSGNDWRGN